MTEAAVEKTETAEEVAAREALEKEEGAKGLAAGFEKVRGKPTEETTTTTTTAAVETVQQTDAEKTAAEEAAKAAAEEAEKAREKAYFESLPASVRDRIEKIDKIEVTVNQVGHFQRKLKTVEDRIEAVSKAGTDAAKAATAAGGTAPTQAQIDAAAAGGGEKWKQMKEDFPEWAEALDERLATLRPGAAAPVDVESIKKEVAGDVDTRIAQATAVAEESAFIRLKHPGWKATVRTPEFKAWHDTQPDDVKALAASNNGDDAVKMLDAFEVHRKAAAAAAAARERQTNRLERAIPVKGSGSPPAPQNDDANALKRGFDRARGVKA